MEAKQVLVEADVCLSTTIRVMDVESNNIIALYERCPGCSRQVNLHVLLPRDIGCNDLHAIDIRFALVVVGVDNPQVITQILCCQRDVATDVAVRIVASPRGLYVWILVLRAPRTCLIVPPGFAKVEVHPGVDHIVSQT